MTDTLTSAQVVENLVKVGLLPAESAIALTAAAIDADGMAWIEVMPTAEKVRNGSWYFTVDANDLGTLVAFLKDNPDRIPVDYDHSGADDGGSTRAAGWFTGESQVVSAGATAPNGDVQDHLSVWARVKWTPGAVQEIKDGVFRFISPEWHFDEKDSKTGLMTKLKDLAAATLTNRPFFKQLAPVTAALEPEQIEALKTEHGDEIAELVLASLEATDERSHRAAEPFVAAVSPSEESERPVAVDPGKPNDNEEEATVVADEQPQVTDYMKMLGIDETVDPKHRIATAFRDKDEQITKLTQDVTELTARASEKGTEAEKLAERLADLEQKDRSRDIEIVLARAIEKGQVLPAEKETLSEVFSDDVAGLRRMVASRPASMFVAPAQGVGGSRSGSSDRFDADPDVASFVAGMETGGDPVDTEQAKVHLIALEILKENGKANDYTNDDYVAAYEAAAKRV